MNEAPQRGAFCAWIFLVACLWLDFSEEWETRRLPKTICQLVVESESGGNGQMRKVMWLLGCSCMVYQLQVCCRTADVCLLNDCAVVFAKNSVLSSFFDT